MIVVFLKTCYISETSNSSYEGEYQFILVEGRSEAEREHFLPHADGFQNLVQRAGKDTLGAVEAEMSARIWLSLVCLLLFPVGS